MLSNTMIHKEMDMFQASVMKLSREIGKAAVLWNDSKYSELSSTISGIANISKDVIVAGDRCCSSIGKFEEIASERY